MPPHSLGSGTISFGLVNIPVRLYTAVSSQNVAFNQLHARCGSRIRQQTFCPTCNEVVERSALVRGWEFAKDQYVQVTDEELKSMEGEASKVIDIAEFVPLPAVDPVYFEKAYFLGPDKGGEKAYRLLADAMAKSDRVALATFVMRGKESLVLIRPALDGLMLHTMYFADEVRSFADIDRGQGAKMREGEIDLALQLIGGLSSNEFRPDRYRDEYRQRVLDMLNAKAEGRPAPAGGAAPERARVVDLMEALKQSLARSGGAPARAGRKAAADEPKKPLAKAGRAAAPAAKKAQGGRK